jgi:ClpP class serine protease
LTSFAKSLTLEKIAAREVVAGIEDVLLGLADRVLDFDEASLTQLQEKYLKKVSEFSPNREWEQAIVVYFLINSIRVKNKIFNEKVKASKTASERPKKSRTLFKIVK